MIPDLAAQLSKAMEGTGPLAVAACFAWGICSVLLSPCQLTSIPLTVAFVDKQSPRSTRRALATSLALAVGILTSIALVGAATAIAGRIIGDVGVWTTYVVAAVFIAVGLHLMDVIGLPWQPTESMGIKPKGMPAAFLTGLIFGVAVSPCAFVFLAPVLGVVFKTAAKLPVYAGLLLAAYGAGYASVIVLAGTCTGLVQRYLDWTEASRGAVIVRRICGGLIIIGGLYLLYKGR